MTVSTIKMTAEQFLQLGEDPPGVRLELVDGEIAVSPSPIPKHSITDKRLSHILMSHILENDLGELLGFPQRFPHHLAGRVVATAIDPVVDELLELRSE